MMMMHCVIQIDDLPERAKKLRADELTEVYGGCTGYDKRCSKDKDCCTPLFCSKGLANEILSAAGMPKTCMPFL